MNKKFLIFLFAITLFMILCGMVTALWAVVETSWIWVPMSLSGVWTVIANWWILSLIVKAWKNDNTNNRRI